MLLERLGLLPRTARQYAVVGVTEFALILFTLWAPFKEGRAISYALAVVLIVHFTFMMGQLIVSPKHRWYRSIWGKLGLGAVSILIAFLALDNGFDLWNTLYGAGVSTDILAIPFYSWWHDVVLSLLVIFGIWQVFLAVQQMVQTRKVPVLLAGVVLALSLFAGLYWTINDTSLAVQQGIVLQTGWQQNVPELFDSGFCNRWDDHSAWGVPFATARIPTRFCYDPDTNQTAVYLNDLTCAVLAVAAATAIVARIKRVKVAAT